MLPPFGGDGGAGGAELSLCERREQARECKWRNADAGKAKKSTTNKLLSRKPSAHLVHAIHYGT